MTNLNEKLAKLVTVREAIVAKEKEIAGFEYESSESEFDSFLDATYGDIDICDTPYSASYAFKNLDPTAYRCSKVDYDSGKDLDNVPEYITLMEELEELENEETDLEDEIEALEQEDNV